MSNIDERIREAVKELPLAAIMHGNKITIADDVSHILGETVTYQQVEEALNTPHSNREKGH